MIGNCYLNSQCFPLLGSRTSSSTNSDNGNSNGGGGGNTNSNEAAGAGNGGNGSSRTGPELSAIDLFIQDILDV